MGKKPTNRDVQFWRDPDLPGVEARYSSYHGDAFRNHTHAAYSIGFIDSGRTSFILEGTSYNAEAGQLVLIQPETVHACNPVPDSNMSYHMFYVNPPWLENIAAEVFGREVGLPIFPTPVLNDPKQVDHWRSLFTAIAGDADKLEKETLLVQGLADLLSNHGELGAARQFDNDKDAVRLVKDHLAANLAEKVSLEELSAMAHLSRYHLLRTFQGSVGLPPHTYQNQLRVDLGKQLLAEGMPISQAAAEAGFVDQSHFSRVFKQLTGATPRQYQTTLSSQG